jgi:anhydro-N-acetylmuramic acid kinase
MKSYHVIGLMSGTSLDGLDIADCSFAPFRGLGAKKWQYRINKAETIPYKQYWSDRLSKIHTYSGEELIFLHNEYGKYLGNEVVKFIGKNKIPKPDFIASHGHTIFHQPKKRFTFQLGNGSDIAAISGIPVVYDFRTLDIALGGQGAPMVPVGDKMLFPEYDYCLNLGGFSNISFDYKGKRVAYDICPVNTILNYLAALNGKKYDKNGSLAKSGRINKELLDTLNGIEYYSKSYPKSLSREWLENNFVPKFDKTNMATEDKLATVTEHIAIQIAKSIVLKKSKVLITGGGANNIFLINCLKSKLPNHEVVIPDSNLINFKEALIFAFLGVLKWENKVNTFKSVTGAKRDSSGGVIFL